MSVTITAVSYTHLDVYKRQPLAGAQEQTLPIDLPTQKGVLV